jgi:hypothetical protein
LKAIDKRHIISDGEYGLEPFDTYKEEVTDALAEKGITSMVELDRTVRDLSHRHMVKRVDVDASHLIQTKSGYVIDFDALREIHMAGENPGECPEK